MVRGSFAPLLRICPNGVVDVLIDRFGAAAWALFNTLKTSSRNCRLFVSVMLIDLERFESKRQTGTVRTTFWPRLPRVPGRGFTRTYFPECPWPSMFAIAPAVPSGRMRAIACRVQRGTPGLMKFKL